LAQVFANCVKNPEFKSFSILPQKRKGYGDVSRNYGQFLFIYFLVVLISSGNPHLSKIFGQIFMLRKYKPQAKMVL
jgi:hypothetical protein